MYLYPNSTVCSGPKRIPTLITPCSEALYTIFLCHEIIEVCTCYSTYALTSSTADNLWQINCVVAGNNFRRLWRVTTETEVVLRHLLPNPGLMVAIHARKTFTPKIVSFVISPEFDLNSLYSVERSELEYNQNLYF